MTIGTRIPDHTTDAVRVLASAKKVVVRVDLVDTYVEGICTPRLDKPAAAEFKELAVLTSGSQGFQDFLKLTETLN